MAYNDQHASPLFWSPGKGGSYNAPQKSYGDVVGQYGRSHPSPLYWPPEVSKPKTGPYRTIPTSWRYPNLAGGGHDKGGEGEMSGGGHEMSGGHRAVTPSNWRPLISGQGLGGLGWGQGVEGGGDIGAGAGPDPMGFQAGQAPVPQPKSFHPHGLPDPSSAKVPPGPGGLQGGLPSQFKTRQPAPHFSKGGTGFMGHGGLPNKMGSGGTTRSRFKQMLR